MAGWRSRVTQGMTVCASGEPIGHPRQAAIGFRREVDFVARFAQNPAVGLAEREGDGILIIGICGDENVHRMRPQGRVGHASRGVAVEAHLVGAISHGLIMPSGSRAVGGVGRGGGVEGCVHLLVAIVAGGAHHHPAGKVGQERRIGGVAQRRTHINPPAVVDLENFIRAAGKSNLDAVGEGDIRAGEEVVTEPADQIGRIAAAGGGVGPIEPGDTDLAGGGDGQCVSLRIRPGVRSAGLYGTRGWNHGTPHVLDPPGSTRVPAM